jgi:hypothetical protein
MSPIVIDTILVAGAGGAALLLTAAVMPTRRRPVARRLVAVSGVLGVLIGAGTFVWGGSAQPATTSGPPGLAGSRPVPSASGRQPDGSTPVGDPSVVATASGSLAPSPPRNLILDYETSAVITVSWQPPASTGSGTVAGYRVRTSPGLSVTTSDTTYSFRQVVRDTTYSIAVSAINSLGLESSASNTVVVHTDRYPYEVTFDRDLTCQSGCAGNSMITTHLYSVVVDNTGVATVQVGFINHTSIEIDAAFDPPDKLTDTSGESDPATAETPARQLSDQTLPYVPVPANSEADYAILFLGLHPLPNTQCTFTSDVAQSGVVDITYDTVLIPCR